jgi:hypothetical protein
MDTSADGAENEGGGTAVGVPTELNTTMVTEPDGRAAAATETHTTAASDIREAHETHSNTVEDGTRIRLAAPERPGEFLFRFGPQLEWFVGEYGAGPAAALVIELRQARVRAIQLLLQSFHPKLNDPTVVALSKALAGMSSPAQPIHRLSRRV